MHILHKDFFWGEIVLEIDSASEPVTKAELVEPDSSKIFLDDFILVKWVSKMMVTFFVTQINYSI